MWRLSLKESQEEQVGLNPLLVEKRLDQLRANRDVRFGRGQEGAWRQAFQVNTHYSLIKGRPGSVGVTQIVGHGDETEAGDVSVVPGLVELFLGRVITGESLSGFLTVKTTISIACRLRDALRSAFTHQLVVA